MLIVQGDNGITVPFVAKKSSSDNLTNATVNVNITRSDGTSINKIATITDPISCLCSFTLFSIDLTVSGLYKYQWVATYPDGRTLSGRMKYFTVAASMLSSVPAANGSGNIADYKAWAFSVPGVAKASIFPLNRGNGTVDILVATAAGVPSTDLIAQVQNVINNNKPVDVDALVIAPTVETINVTAKVAVQPGYTVAGVTQAVQQSIASYVENVPIGGTVYGSQMIAAILTVNGVTDCSVTLSVNGTSSNNVVLTSSQLAQVGAATVQGM